MIITTVERKNEVPALLLCNAPIGVPLVTDPDNIHTYTGTFIVVLEQEAKVERLIETDNKNRSGLIGFKREMLVLMVSIQHGNVGMPNELYIDYVPEDLEVFENDAVHLQLTF